MHNKINILAGLLALIFGLSSCLKGNLPDLPAYSDADITELYSQYRYLDTEQYPDGSNIVRIVTLSVSDKSFSNGTASATVTVPDASSFTVPGERDKVSATNIVMMCNISTGASIEPLEGAPKLGMPGDFSKLQKYKVTAADGKTSKVGSISINVVK